jgi:gamma-glutamyl hydrolase
VKLLESSGAKIVPIPWNTTKENLKYIFEHLNGILMPGGDADFMSNATEGKNGFMNTMGYLFELTVEANDKGDYFPLLTICQGMEALHFKLAKYNTSVFVNATDLDKSHNLQLETLNFDGISL